MFFEKVSKGKTREKLMKCELKQQIGHSNVSIAQHAIHKAAKVENDSKIIKLCEARGLIASFMLL